MLPSDLNGPKKDTITQYIGRRFFSIDFFEFLTTSQSFPLIMEANLCRNIPDYLQSYIVRQREVNKKSLSENCQN